MAAEIRIDGEFVGIIPSLSPEELSNLEANIVADGCRDPLIIWKEEGILLDGHNRYEICTRLGLAFQTVEEALPDRGEAVEWIIRNQFGRRNLVPFVRAELAIKLEPIRRAKYEARAKAAQKAGGGSGISGRKKSAEPNNTRDGLAELADLSHDTLSKARVRAESKLTSWPPAPRHTDTVTANLTSSATFPQAATWIFTR